jgi:6-phosphogluconolactonase
MDRRPIIFFVGTYTAGDSRGIYRSLVDSETGQILDINLAAEADNPSFLAVHPHRPVILAVNERVSSASEGRVSAYTVDRETGALSYVNSVSSRGAAPCNVSVDAGGNWALVANYGSGSVACFPIGSDGRLGEASSLVKMRGSGPVPKRQDRPHVHCAVAAPRSRFVVGADLGTDRIFALRFDTGRGKLKLVRRAGGSAAPGSGPRHVVFDGTGRHCYAINELNSTVTAYAFEAGSGAANPIHSVSTLPRGFAEQNTGADLHISRDGRFLYASNRGHDSIAILEVRDRGAELRPTAFVPTGRSPRGFSIAPDGQVLVAACQDGHCLESFRIDQDSGALTPAGRSRAIDSPVCVAFLS